MAERRGTGLQSRARGFESRPHLRERDTVTTALSVWEHAARAYERRTKPNIYLYDPAGFARDIIIWPPGQCLTDYQGDILTALPHHRRVTVRGPHGLGKTGTAAFVVLWFATTRQLAGWDWKVITTASAWRHLQVYLWPEIHKWVKRINWERLGMLPWTDHQLLDLRIKLGDGAASAVASSDPAKIEGAHADSLLYLFDEAKSIPGETWDAVEGAFSGGMFEGLPEAFALAASTPGSPTGRFYDIHSRKPGFEDWHVRHVTLEEAIRAGRISADWAEQRARQWGEDSALYANRVLGEFHASDEDAVIPLSWVEAAIDRWHVWHDDGEPPLEGRATIGVDVAREGGDRTILAHRVGSAILRMDGYRREDTMMTSAHVTAAVSGRDGVLPVVDSAGVGGGVVDRLRELNVPVEPYTGAAKPKRRVRDRAGEHGFTNVRSAAYWRMRELLDPAFGSEVMLPPSDLLISDLTAPTWTITTGVPPLIKVEPKDQVVARLGRSPDEGDAVVMAFWGGSADQITVRSPNKRTGSTKAAQRYSRRTMSK